MVGNAARKYLPGMAVSGISGFQNQPIRSIDGNKAVCEALRFNLKKDKCRRAACHCETGESLHFRGQDDGIEHGEVVAGTPRYDEDVPDDVVIGNSLPRVKHNA